MMETIFLLHGALGSAGQMQLLVKILEHKYRVVCPDLPGHGSRTGGNVFSINGFTEDVAGMIQPGEKVFIFGYSMGGYVALKLGLQYPELVKGIVTLGTQLKWDPAIAENECRMLDPETIKSKVPSFAEELRQRHGNWEELLHKTAGLLRAIGQVNPLQNSDYPNVKPATLLMLGDRDKTASLEETVAANRSIPNSQMAILPATPHPFEKVDKEMVSYFLQRFISAVE